MWWCDRRTFLAGVALAGCGFQPVYGPRGAANGVHGQVAIDPPRDASGFAFVRHLETRLGLPESPTYRLSADISISETELGVTPDQVISRYQLVGRAQYSLIRLANQEVLRSGRVDNFTSYSATGTPFATRTALLDARDRLMVVLADQVVSELLITGEDWR
ncbi:MAG: LPS assembly lipoprotein LptE [Pseudomonadota bacterium]